MTAGARQQAPRPEEGQPGWYITPGARRAAHRLARSLIVVFLVAIAVGAANLVFTGSQVRDAEARATTACAFWRDLAGLPVTPAPGTTRPTLLAVEIVAHSREAYRGFRCAGPVPPPAPSFQKWARYYRVSPG